MLWGDLDTARPVGVHAAVLVVEALQLEFKVRPEHQGLMHLGRRGVGEPGLELGRMLHVCK